MLCSDGRWYHPTLCEIVNETWDRLSEKRRADRQRKAVSRAKTRGVTPQEADVTRDQAKVTPDNVENDRDEPTHTGEDIQEKKGSPEGDSGAGAPELPLAGPDGMDRAVEAYAALAGRQPQVCGLRGDLNETRRKKLKATLKRHHLTGWLEALQIAEMSPFLMGKTSAGFRLTIDFLLQPSSFQKLIEGKYSDGGIPHVTGTGPGGGLSKRGDAIRGLHEAAMGLLDGDGEGHGGHPGADSDDY
jgi:hypothetical protein